jgi:hypothetical protein
MQTRLSKAKNPASFQISDSFIASAGAGTFLPRSIGHFEDFSKKFSVFAGKNGRECDFRKKLLVCVPVVYKIGYIVIQGRLINDRTDMLQKRKRLLRTYAGRKRTLART